jgi:hypothetical protein
VSDTEDQFQQGLRDVERSRITELEYQQKELTESRDFWKAENTKLEAEIDGRRTGAHSLVDENTKLREAAQAEIDAQQDRYAANSDSELAKANAKYEVAYDNLKAALGDKPEGHRTMCASNYRRGDVYPCDCDYDKTLEDKP